MTFNTTPSFNTVISWYIYPGCKSLKLGHTYCTSYFKKKAQSLPVMADCHCSFYHMLFIVDAVSPASGPACRWRRSLRWTSSRPPTWPRTLTAGSGSFCLVSSAGGRSIAVGREAPPSSPPRPSSLRNKMAAGRGLRDRSPSRTNTCRGRSWP